ncbi:argininosuccinate synthase-related protein [Vibrio maritimus]
MKKLRSIEDLLLMSTQCKHILTLFSGGLDSAYLLSLLSESKAKVTALVVDVGETYDRQRLQIVCDHFDVELAIVDAKQDFIEYGVLPAIQSQAYYLGDYPVSSSLSRPIIAQHAVNIAKKLGCDAIVHTATQSQNSLRRLNGAIQTLGFDGYYGSPYEYSAISREEKTDHLAEQGLMHFKGREVSSDSNLWCREFESGVMDNPEDFADPNSHFSWAVWEPEHHLENHTIKIGFHKGHPVELNGRAIQLSQLISYLNRHIGGYEIGRYVGFDHLEEDEKVLEIREAPAATLLMSAFKLLSVATLPTDILRAKRVHDDAWTMEAVEGRWNSLAQQMSYQYISTLSESITGDVTFTLTRGAALPSAIYAENARYLKNRDEWEKLVTKERSLRTVKARAGFDLDSNVA